MIILSKWISPEIAEDQVFLLNKVGIISKVELGPGNHNHHLRTIRVHKDNLREAKRVISVNSPEYRKMFAEQCTAAKRPLPPWMKI